MIIYQAICVVTNKCYIGKTIKDLEARKYMHRWCSDNGGKSKFYNAIRKHGFNNFSWQIICICESEEDLCKKEIKLIQEYDSIKNGYNTSTGGDGGDNFTNHPNKEEIREKIKKSTTGIKRSDAFKVKNRERQIGRIISEETKTKISESLKGRTISEEHREKISKTLKGRPMAEETKMKISKTSTGKSFSEEHKQKISQAHTGKVLSEETKTKIGQASKGRVCSEETRRKMSLTRKGRSLSPEHRAKLTAINQQRAFEKRNSLTK